MTVHDHRVRAAERRRAEVAAVKAAANNAGWDRVAAIPTRTTSTTAEVRHHAELVREAAAARAKVAAVKAAETTASWSAVIARINGTKAPKGNDLHGWSAIVAAHNSRHRR